MLVSIAGPDSAQDRRSQGEGEHSKPAASAVLCRRRRELQAAKNTEHDFMFTETLSEAITSDPGFNGGKYGSPTDVAAGLHRHAKPWTVMGWSTEFFREGRHKALGFGSVQAFVDTFMTGYFAPMDPNDLLAMAWKWQRGDVSRNTGNDLASALGRIKAKTYVMPISHDMLFPPNDCEVEQRLIPGSQFRPEKHLRTSRPVRHRSRAARAA